MGVEIQILAMLMALQPPGQSTYSRMTVDEDSTPPCEHRYEPLCAPPKWDKKRDAWTVAETSDRGRIRYKVIAEAIKLEAWRIPPSRRDKMRRLLVASFHGESGFREDIHSGIGKHSRGDCKGGRCKSHCLGQIMIPRHGGKVPLIAEVVRAKDLVGVDLKSTRTCARVTVELLRRAWIQCSGFPRCIFTVYMGATSSKHPRVHSRVGIFNKLRGMKL